MSKIKKYSFFSLLVAFVLGIVVLFGIQKIMKATNSTEFCVSCHSMEQPKLEWEGSSHFSNRKGIRAECVDCHVPQDGLHYVKTKFMALKDVWATMTNKLPDQTAFEKHRLAMAKNVWAEMKANDSATCRSCHSFDAMELSEQKEAAQKMHKIAQETAQTCIDCHKGIVHFMPEMSEDTSTTSTQTATGITDNSTLYTKSITTAQLTSGQEIRLFPYAELTHVKDDGEKISATIHGWQQVGAESIVYLELGKRVMVALLDDEAKDKITVLKTVQDEITASEWKEVKADILVAKNALTGDLNALNQMGDTLNQTHCSGCHSPIGAEHYTANQWIGVVNSMKDRTSMSADEVRTLTIYLQRNAKDMGHSH
ncbi:nitrate reductase [Pasteurellaceae bacterium Macca]|nr:nitrate reductase [Pasteurellaceae bacterium Macca]